VTRGSSSSTLCSTPFTASVTDRLMWCSNEAVADSRAFAEDASAFQAGAGEMADEPGRDARRPRADALRNRERVLEAAKTVFSSGGPDASLEAIARRAGVGIGTLYRHFPTREALFEGVYRREVEQLVDLAEHLKVTSDPVDALRRWMRSNVEFVATKKGMSAALALTAHGTSQLTAYSLDRLTRAVDGLLQRAVAAGEIRSDISAEDILRTLVGICYAQDKSGWQANVLRLVDVFIDGLCRQPTDGISLPPRC
jgi:AcrR family transcriptional regulator